LYMTTKFDFIQMKQTYCFLFFILSFACVLKAQDRTSGRSFATRSEVLATSGMVATNHPLATQIGLDILKKGGSAIDAAIAANAFLGLADPAMNGIGGDLFAVVWEARTNKLYGLNASGRSPEGVTLAYFKEKGYAQVPAMGPLSVTVPGCVDGWVELNKKFGKLSLAQLLAPAISYARAGVPITQEVADLMIEPRLLSRIGLKDTGRFSNFRKQYMKNGAFPVKGELYKNPELARTLELISKKGRDGYYKGEVAQAIAAHIRKEGGFLSTDDLAAHRSEWVEPVSTNYRGYDVWELPPNGQGISVLQMLNILEGYDLAKAGFGSKEHIHYFTEAKKIAYEDLATYYGDPAFNHIPLTKLLSKEYAAGRRKLISPTQAGIYEPGLALPGHTIYLTAADKEGNMVSLIQSNAAPFGSLEVPAGLGFVLHNRGAFYELSENHINAFAPGKRPFHTIIPAFITKDGKPFMSFGLMGGDMQPQGHVQMVMNIIDFGMNLQEAGDAPRIYHEGTFARLGHVNEVGTLYLESGFPYETIRDLMLMGHKVSYAYGLFGGYQAIMRKDGVYYGASESRKDGQAAGY
jgi:gamma-glutamyltranspeptidase / glutathione hydrolase